MTTKERTKIECDLGAAIKSLDVNNKDWQYSVTGATVDGIVFLKDDGEGNAIPDSRPADFPSNSEIVSRQADMHSKADAGKTFAEIIASY
tara:strand:- start:248 stop:517 length:270 start_codon:yes stop_codon:yes gene_type:complete